MPHTQPPCALRQQNTRFAQRTRRAHGPHPPAIACSHSTETHGDAGTVMLARQPCSCFARRGGGLATTQQLPVLHVPCHPTAASALLDPPPLAGFLGARTLWACDGDRRGCSGRLWARLHSHADQSVNTGGGDISLPFCTRAWAVVLRARARARNPPSPSNYFQGPLPIPAVDHNPLSIMPVTNVVE
jgi:hypothetical protein